MKIRKPMKLGDQFPGVILGGPPQTVIGHGAENLMRRLPHKDDPNDISYWTIRNINFPEEFSFAGWNMRRVKFVECDISKCDFTGADTHEMSLDMCTVGEPDTNNGVKGLDFNTLSENNMQNPYEVIAELTAASLPRRRRSEIPNYGARKLT